MGTDIKKARELILECPYHKLPEKVPLEEARGRVLAEDVLAEMDIPPFERSPLDGYAFRAADTVRFEENGSPAILKVLDTVGSGSFFAGKVTPGCCVRVMTGAPVPEGADAVVAREKVSTEGDQVLLQKAFQSGENIVRVGEDIKENERIMTNGTVIQEAHLGVLASLGRVEALVYQKPVVAVISTGSELVPPGAPRKEFQIYDSNTVMIGAMVEACGGIPVNYGPVPDNVDSMVPAFNRAISECDVVVSTGGVSAGDYDLLPRVAEETGAGEMFHGLDMKPGTPMMVARKEKKMLFCLSGNPGAASLTFDLFVRPFFYRMTGRKNWRRPLVNAFLEHPVQRGGRDPRFIRSWCTYRQGYYYVRDPRFERAGVLSSLLKSNSLIYLPRDNSPLETGDTIEVELTRLPEVK